MIGSQAGIWVMIGKDRKTPIVGGVGVEKKRETVDSIQSRARSFVPISTHGPPQGPLPLDPALL